MPTQLPVPSKAALTALRGLIVGTSCTIALIAEDRRRRINQAVSVIQNGERLKSAKGYHGDAATKALLGIEENILFESQSSLFASQPSESMKLSRNLDRHTASEQELLDRPDLFSYGPAAPRPSADNGATPANPDADSHSQAADSVHPDYGIHDFTPLPSKEMSARSHTFGLVGFYPNRLDLRASKPNATTAPPSDETMSKVFRYCYAKSPQQIDAALQLVLEAYSKMPIPANSNTSWVQTTAMLCRTCQELGRFDDAAHVLQLVVTSGKINEVDYLAHQPLPLIENLLAKIRPNGCDSGRNGPLSLEEKAEISAAVNTAVSLFTPTFGEVATIVESQARELGKKLIEVCAAAGKPRRAIYVYQRCAVGMESVDLWDFTHWTMEKLHNAGEYESVVTLFNIIQPYVNEKFSRSFIACAGDLVSKSALQAHSRQSAQVIKRLLEFAAAGKYKLRCDEFGRLLSTARLVSGSFREFESLVEQVLSYDLLRILDFPDVVFRIAAEAALEAGHHEKAGAYLDQAILLMPQIASETRMLGMLARFSAKNGDWDGVKNAFKSMNHKTPGHRKSAGKNLVPILKDYFAGHTISEGEAFLDFFLKELNLPINGFTVTLVAKEYARYRDFDGLVRWLKYCDESADYETNASFTNAILVSCRKEWNMPFRDMRTLFRKLRLLHPKFVDRHTERIMIQAALAEGDPSLAKGRVNSLRIDVTRLPAKGKCKSVPEVVLAMKEALTYKRPAQALDVYQKSLKAQLPYSRDVLRLAVQAEMMHAKNGEGHDKALAHLEAAQAKGNDITSALNFVLVKRLEQVLRRGGTSSANQVYEGIKTALEGFIQRGIDLRDEIYNKAAVMCLRSNSYPGAIEYAMSAAKTRYGGEFKPCYSLTNFRILLKAYAAMVDVHGLEAVLETGLTMKYKESEPCLKALKSAAKQVLKTPYAAAATDERRSQAKHLIQAALDKIMSARKRLRDERAVLEDTTVSIAQKVALADGRPPVDFETGNWLNPDWRDQEVDDARDFAVSEDDGLVSSDDDNAYDPNIERVLRTAAKNRMSQPPRKPQRPRSPATEDGWLNPEWKDQMVGGRKKDVPDIAAMIRAEA